MWNGDGEYSSGRGLIIDLYFSFQFVNNLFDVVQPNTGALGGRKA